MEMAHDVIFSNLACHPAFSVLIVLRLKGKSHRLKSMKTTNMSAPIQTLNSHDRSESPRIFHSVMRLAFLICLCFGLAGCASQAAKQAALQETTTSDAANNWLRVQVDPSLAPDIVWQKLVDSVTGCYPSLEMIDAASGYMRSVYNIRKFGRPGSGEEFEVRTRFICSISSKSPLVYKMKIESEWSTPQQDWAPYDRVFKQDAELVEELQSRLGVK
jgi:hypothetical protein